jgi:ribosomal protein S18 acetylase RimI-like enzyme
MNEFVIRNATISDVPFLVDTIIESEKSGTDKLSYSTVFGLSETESRKYIADMLLEEVDGCELSISSFLIAEMNGRIAAASAAWIEGMDGIPSTVLKGNLLNYILPKKCFGRALAIDLILRDIHIDYVSGAIQLGLVYVESDFRGFNLVGMLIDEHIHQYQKLHPDIDAMYVQVFGNNLRAIRAYEKADFRVVLIRESANKEVMRYLPSNKKIVMKKILPQKKGSE